MIKFFALTLDQIGISKFEYTIIGATILVFPILFIFASKNLDPKGVFQWMMEKPDEWIGRK